MSNLNLNEFNKLPHFLVRDRFVRDGKMYLEGVFQPPYDQLWASGFLYLLQLERPWSADFFSILWTAPDSSSSILSLRDDAKLKELSVGKSYPAGKWNARQLLLILDQDAEWKERTFQSSDVWSYVKDRGWRVTLSPGTMPPDGAKGVKKLPKGWDHEHCVFCWATISEHEEKTGYVAKNMF